MASPSSKKACALSSSSPPRWTHDVFLSFCGKDTRNNFTDHLYVALKQKSINAYKDDEKLEQGTFLGPELMKVIEESNYSIIVLSKNYAFLKWCLDELVQILNCEEKKGLKVLPVFYHVDPSDVRHQKGTFEKAFLEHGNNPNVTIEKIQKWKAALTKVAGVVGWHLSDR